jgi:CubicO group peptidase (beta-lactamase class C family)
VTEDPRYPFGQALNYAHPLRLRAAGPNAWRATAQPLEDTFTLYLAIFRDKDGALKAAFRNPEQNSHGPAMQYAVSRSGDDLQFTAPGQAGAQLHARMLLGPDRIEIAWEDMKRPIELARTSPDVADRYAARPPKTAPYAYRPPQQTGDGWAVARARDVGMDEGALQKVVQRIIDIDPTGQRPWMIHSIAVARHGKLVLDEYFYGYGRDEPHDTRSASKTFSSVMLGALMRQGAAISPDTKVYEAMAPRGPFANPDPRKARVTLGQLLTHSAGFACDDNAEVSTGNEDMIESDRAHPDWTKVTLDLPMQFEPGAHYAYCSMNISLAGAVLSQVSGEWLPALFDRTVARPLQFGAYHWNLMPTGDGYLGGGVFVRTRDFLKLGQVYLDGGVWNGRRIVDASWVKDSLSPHARISPATTGLQGDAFQQVYWETDDGWAWHMIDVKSGDRTYKAFHANGNGGQLLIIVPEFDLAVMFTAGNYQQGLWNRERDDIVGGMIIPAIVTPGTR